MRIEFAATRSRTAASRFISVYDGDGKYPKNQITCDKLRALPPEQQLPGIIAAIIGNQSWTHPDCDECGIYVDVAITLGEESGDGITVCLPCLKGSAAALAAAQSAMANLLQATGETT